MQFYRQILFFFKLDSLRVWSNFLGQFYVIIQDLGPFGGSDPGIKLDHLKKVKKHFKEWKSISATEHAGYMVLVANPMFLGMENHLGQFSEASDRPEGHEQGGGAEGGQEALQGVKFYLSFWAC